MMRRLALLAAGVLALTLLFTAPSGAQQSPGTVPPTVLPSSTVPTPPSTRPPTRPSTTPSTRPPQRPTTSVVVGGEQAENPPTLPRDTRPEVRGDVISRPLPRTGTDLDGTALFGGALTVAGVGIALAARRRRSAFDG